QEKRLSIRTRLGRRNAPCPPVSRFMTAGRARPGRILIGEWILYFTIPGAPARFRSRRVRRPYLVAVLFASYSLLSTGKGQGKEAIKEPSPAARERVRAMVRPLQRTTH